MKRGVTGGLRWTVIETWGRQGLNLVVFIILARLLTPVDFGVVALAGVFVAFAQLVVDQGLGDALIQRRQIARTHVDTAFWVALATGALLTVAGLASATPIANLLGEPSLGPILQVLSLTFVLGAFTSIQVALLRRRFEFRGLAVRALGAAAGGGVVGVLLAVMGAGAWALVAQQVVAAMVSVALLWRISPWRPSLHFSTSEFRELLRFGLHVVGSDVLNFLSRNIDNLLIGVVLGTTQLGYYAVAYRILSVTQTVLVNIARRITFPALSRLQDDPTRMRRAYYRITRAASVLILPGYIGLALVAPELTVTLFGQRWEPSGPVASVLFLIGPVLTVQAFAGSMLNAAGRPDVVFRFRLITSVTNIAGFALAVSFGIVAVAVAFVVRGYLLVPLMLRWMRIHADIPASEYLAQLRGVATATLVMAGALLATKAVLGGQPPGILLAAEVLVGAATFVGTLVIVEPSLLREAAGVARDAALPRRDAEDPPRAPVTGGAGRDGA